MKAFLAAITNWRTSIVGSLAFLTSLVNNTDKLQFGTPQEKINLLMSSLSLLLLGFFAKDAAKDLNGELKK